MVNNMGFWLEFLPIIIYILVIIILLVGIVLGIKFIITLGKVEKVVDNVSTKVKALDGIFNIIDSTTDKIVLVTDKVLDGLTSVIAKIFFSSKKEEKVEKVSKKKGGE